MQTRGLGHLFQQLMQDQQGVELFRKFLETNGQSYTLDFILDHKMWGEKKCTEDEKKNLAYDIYKKYLITTATHPVSLPPHLKTSIDNFFSNPSNTFKRDIFDLAINDVSSKLVEEWFKRFVRSAQYEKYQSSMPKRHDADVMICKLPGEALVLQVPHVSYYNSFKKAFVPSGLYITNFRLIFGTFSDPTKSTDLELLDELMSMPLTCVHRITRVHQKPQLIETLEIHGKDFRKIEFQLAGGLSTSVPSLALKNLKHSIKALCFPRAPTDLFAYHFKPSWNDRKDWQRFNIYEEFLRQGISFNSWRFTDINHDYSMCSSYPSRFVVPAAISDDQLVPVFGFRSKGRIPILCWSHPINGASISRSSQPNSGVLRARCLEDEILLKSIGETGGNTQTLFFLDARPRANAIGNTVKGKGFESVSAYPNSKIEFLGIANIHVMRESLQKIEAISISGNEDQWFSKLDNSQWFSHIKDILVGSMRVVELVEEGYPVLLHCSDGWDRTAQLSSLALLLLDSYYRTIPGFIVLIEKEWLSCGHRFLSRTGHGIKNYSDQNRSPVFLQFLDCVYQITLQFGCSFAFNETFLLTIAQHLYTCQFGTFLWDSDQDRQTYQVTTKTTSLWSYIRAHISEFENPFYMPDSNVLKLGVHMDKLELWSRLYYMWTRKSTVSIVTTEMRGTMLKSLNEQLTKRVKELEKEALSLKTENLHLQTVPTVPSTEPATHTDQSAN